MKKNEMDEARDKYGGEGISIRRFGLKIWEKGATSKT